MSKLQLFYKILTLCILAVIILLASRIITSSRIENFETKTNYDKLNIKRISNGKTLLGKKQCIVQIITTDDQLDSTQTEIRKMFKTFANAPIIASQNRINQNNNKLFKDYKMMFDKVMNVTNNPYKDNQPIIHFITKDNNFTVKGLITTQDTAYTIVMKIIKYLGLQTAYQ
jgi:hypothetical protein